MASKNNSQDTKWISDASKVVKPGENITTKERELVNEIEQLNQSTILNFVDGFHQSNELQKIQSITSQKPRVDWQVISDFSSDRVLDINGGYGGLPHPVTRQAEEMVLLSPFTNQARFAAEASTMCGYDNFTTVQSSIKNLPVEDNSIDHLIINNLLEDTSLLFKTYGKVPSRAITCFLKDTFEKLKPGGKIYISAENRFNPRHFVERSKEGVGIRRFIPNVLQRDKDRKNILWSERQYYQFLVQSGFDSLTTYYSLDKKSEYTLFPDGDTLTNYLSWNTSELTSLLPLPVPNSVISKLFIRIDTLGERFAPGFLIVGSKPKI